MTSPAAGKWGERLWLVAGSVHMIAFMMTAIWDYPGLVPWVAGGFFLTGGYIAIQRPRIAHAEQPPLPASVARLENPSVGVAAMLVGAETLWSGAIPVDLAFLLMAWPTLLRLYLKRKDGRAKEQAAS